jgi:mercuric ion transport protein
MTTTAVKRTLVTLPGVGVSLLPKLMCPACWPAYSGIVSALGLGFLISAKYLLPLTVACLAITALALGCRASRRHGYGPFWMGFAAAAMILTGKFYFDVAQATYAGLGLLIAASVWNSWPRHAVTVPFCSACVPAGAGSTQRDAQGEETHETQN